MKSCGIHLKTLYISLKERKKFQNYSIHFLLYMYIYVYIVRMLKDASTFDRMEEKKSFKFIGSVCWDQVPIRS